MKRTNTITGSMEDYLEAVSIASAKDGAARVTDIKKLLNVKTPSVTGAIAALGKLGFVTHEKYGRVQLTKKGQAVAREVKKKHAAISAFLRDILGVSADAADIDACKIEHVISKETFQKLTDFLEKNKK